MAFRAGRTVSVNADVHPAASWSAKRMAASYADVRAAENMSSKRKYVYAQRNRPVNLRASLVPIAAAAAAPTGSSITKKKTPAVAVSKNSSALKKASY